MVATRRTRARQGPLAGLVVLVLVVGSSTRAVGAEEPPAGGLSCALCRSGGEDGYVQRTDVDDESGRGGCLHHGAAGHDGRRGGASPNRGPGR